MPPARPSFSLSPTPTCDDDEFALWQARLDAARVMTPARERVAAACRAAEAALGIGARRR